MRSNNRSTAFFVSALVAGAATVFALMMLTDEDTSSDTPRSAFRTPEATVSASPSPDGEPEEPARFATDSLINREGSYSFGHPPTWEVVTDGSVSTITSPEEDVVIRLGFGPQGSLPSATTELSELVRSSYEVSRMGPPRQTFIGGASALVFAGRAMNDADTEMRFEFTSIEGPDGENYAISVFSYPNIGKRFELTIEEVIASFRVVGTS